MFLVAKCLARLAHLLFNCGVEFSPVGNWLKDYPSLGLIGICSNQQEALALPGHIHGFLCDLVLNLGFPDLDQ